MQELVQSEFGIGGTFFLEISNLLLNDRCINKKSHIINEIV